MFVEAGGDLASHSRTAFPSGVSCSADGQFLILTHGFLHILTPCLGLGVREDRSALSGLPGNKLPDQWADDKCALEFEQDECSGLPIFKTSIPVSKRTIDWEDFTLESRLTVSGGLDNGWRMASWSPSGLYQTGGWCLLATLNLNREVMIYAPGSDAIKDAWTETFNLSSAYMDTLRSEPFIPYYQDTTTPLDEQKYKRDVFTTRAQLTSIAWSPAGPAPSTRDDSLLAVGHKSGHVSFWSYMAEDSTMKLVMEHRVLEEWPVVMAWSTWRSTTNEQGSSMIDLAVAPASGCVQIVRISLSADGKTEAHIQAAICSSAKAVTVLRWLNPSILIIGRLSQVSIWSPTSTHIVEIPIEDFRGWTSIPTPIDFVYQSSTDSLSVCMTDGTTRSIESVTGTTPRLGDLRSSKTARNGSAKLSEDINKSFRAVEKTANKAKTKVPLPSAAAMTLSGMLQLDKSGTVLWAFEKYQLDRRIYTIANFKRINFIFARFSNDNLQKQILKEVQQALEVDAVSGSAVAPLKTLFPILLTLRHFLYKADFLEELLATISSGADAHIGPHAPWATVDDHLTHLLGDTALQRLRLASLLTRHIQRFATVPDITASYEHLQKFELAICLLVFRVLRSLLSISCSEETLTGIRYKKVIATLEERQSGTMEVDEEEETSIEVFPAVLDEEDRCAACKEFIGFDALGKATCRNGHAWIRCSITLEVMFSASARTCTVCSRKSQVPKSANAELDAAGQASQRLLRAAKYCLFCGGRWSESR